MKNEKETQLLIQQIVEGIFKKKGNDVIRLGLKQLGGSICDHFIICDADTPPQVRAIAESIEETVENELNLRVYRRSGIENAQWITLDYYDVVVHIFQRVYRTFYDLEGLWADAETQTYQDTLQLI